jgi:hypothetical protein
MRCPDAAPAGLKTCLTKAVQTYSAPKDNTGLIAYSSQVISKARMTIALSASGRNRGAMRRADGDSIRLGTNLAQDASSALAVRARARSPSVIALVLFETA